MRDHLCRASRLRRVRSDRGHTANVVAHAGECGLSLTLRCSHGFGSRREGCVGLQACGLGRGRSFGALAFLNGGALVPDSRRSPGVHAYVAERSSLASACPLASIVWPPCQRSCLSLRRSATPHSSVRLPLAYSVAKSGCLCHPARARASGSATCQGALGAHAFVWALGFAPGFPATGHYPPRIPARGSSNSLARDDAQAV